MNDYLKKQTYWSNRRIVAGLKNFYQDLETYIEQSSYSWEAEAVIEKDPAKEAKVRMNRVLHRVISAIEGARLPTVITYTPAPAIGGLVQNIDILQNLFILHQFEIPKDRVIDLVDRAIGIYEDDRWTSLFRTINPLWWLWKGALFIAAFPFRLLSTAGFKTENIENSFFGRLVKLIFAVIPFSAAFLMLLKLLGFLESFKRMIGITA